MFANLLKIKQRCRAGVALNGATMDDGKTLFGITVTQANDRSKIHKGYIIMTIDRKIDKGGYLDQYLHFRGRRGIPLCDRSVYNVMYSLIIHSIVCFGVSPVSIAFAHPQVKKYKYSTQDGIIDTLQHLLYHQNFIKPYSDEHYFVHLLTKSF